MAHEILIESVAQTFYPRRTTNSLDFPVDQLINSSIESEIFVKQRKNEAKRIVDSSPETNEFQHRNELSNTSSQSSEEDDCDMFLKKGNFIYGMCYVYLSAH